MRPLPLALSSFLIGLVLVSCGGSTEVSPTDSTAISSPDQEQFSNTYHLFESGQVKPIIFNAHRSELYVLNTPDNRLEIFTVDNANLSHKQSLFSGLEPVSMALKGPNELWIVNHLSDSVSVVEIDDFNAKVVKTLYVGDEPRDIVFAGTENNYAFITTAHRGQHSDSELRQSSSGVSRADVWVFDVNDLGNSPGGNPIKVLNLFGDTPRPLARSIDGSKIYVGIFNSGNQTTSLLATSRLDKAEPRTNKDGVHEPDSSLIVKFIEGKWSDERGMDYSRMVRLKLPDYDVFEIDASTFPFEVLKRHSQVGTTLYNMAVNPVNDELIVANTDARNEIRFVGDNTSNNSLNGHFVINQLSVIGTDSVTKIDLNPHIAKEKTQGNSTNRSLSISQPMQFQFINTGKELLLTSFGTKKIIRISQEQLTQNNYYPNPDLQIILSAGGPSGVVTNSDESLAFVYTRFDNGVSIIDLQSNTEIDHIQIYSPEPDPIIQGRKFLYDAILTSGHGNVSCGSCHIFGDMDHLAWDLGHPDGSVETIELPYQPNQSAGAKKMFHPLKGPMTTQSMRGLKNHGPMHWRGDRTGKNRQAGESLERAAFKEFNEAFTLLMGRDAEISRIEMEQFADFAMALQYPPNPNRNLDNSLSAIQNQGKTHYDNRCSNCHTLIPEQGIFGTTGLMARPTQGSDQDVKIPHFRNLYQKIGMYGSPASSSVNTGDQIRGFGFLHNGSLDLKGIFSIFSNVVGLEEFLMAYPSTHAPIVGQQITVGLHNQSSYTEILNLFTQRAMINNGNGECDLIVTAFLDGSHSGYYLKNNGKYLSDMASESELTRQQLLDKIQTSEDFMTFSCLPLESGYRNAVDRDFNGILNRDDAQFNPILDS